MDSWVKAQQRVNSNGRNTCKCHKPLGGCCFGTFSMLGLEVKALDRRGLNDGGMVHHGALIPLGHHGALIPLGLVLLSLVASSGSSCTFYL
jgi:hypothetical protein